MNIKIMSYAAAAFVMAASALSGQPAAAQPAFSKVFSPDTIAPGGSSQLIFTIDNSSGDPVTDLAFTDILPAAVTITSPANASTDCIGATLSAPSGGSTITFTDGGVAGSSSCDVYVDVTSSDVGTHQNVSGDLTSSAGNSGPATDDLIVATDRPSFSKTVSPSTVDFGGVATVTYTIDNSLNGEFSRNQSFSETLPAGATVSSPANVTSDCIGGTASVTATAGGNTISYSGNSDVQAAGTSCAITVDVIGGVVGSNILKSGEFTSLTGTSFSVLNSGFSIATLNVNAPDELSISKSFNPGTVMPGATTDLEFTIRNLSRTDTLTNIAFSDDLSAALTGLEATGTPLSNICGAGSELLGTSTLSFSGGSLAPGESCTFSATVQVPVAAAADTYTNTTSTVTAELAGNPVVAPAASASLTVLDAQLSFSSAFSPDTVNPGDAATLTYTIDNTGTTSASGLAFEDRVTDSIPHVTLSTASAPISDCGGFSSFLTSGSDAIGLFLSNGSLSAGASCTISVGVTVANGAPVGTASTQSDSLTYDGGDTGLIASAPLTVDGDVELTLAKAFADDTATAGTVTEVTFTISNTSETIAAESISFTDDLDTFHTGATLDSVVSNTCTGSTAGQGGSASEFSLTGGSLDVLDNCSVTIGILLGAGTGAATNTTSNLTAAPQGGSAAEVPATSASDDITIFDFVPPTLSKEFIDDPLLPGGSGTLRFTIDNTQGAVNLTGGTFTDDADANMAGFVFTSTFPIANVCGAGSEASVSGSTLIVTGANLVAGTSCTFELTFTAPVLDDGDYANVTSTLSGAMGGTAFSSPAAQDSLTLFSDYLVVSKSLSVSEANPGELLDLTIEITNTYSETVTDLAIDDNLNEWLDGVQVSSPLTTCGGSVDILSAVLSLTGGTLAAGTSCTVTATIEVPASMPPDSYLNTTTAPSGTVGASPVSGIAASASLQILDPDAATLSKSFGTAVLPGETVDLTFTITNPSATQTASNLNFSDDLDAMLSGTVATGLPASDVCGAGSEISGSSLLNVTGASLAPGASCDITVTLEIPSTATPDSYLNTTSDLTSNGLVVAPAATANLTVDPAPLFDKAFETNPVEAESASTLTFTIDNSASSFDATALDFIDNFPAGMVVADPANVQNSCTGGIVTAEVGAAAASYTGGSVAAGASCQISVDVTVPTAGGYVNTTDDLTSSHGNSGTASDTLTVDPKPTGDVTVVVNTEVDGTYPFASIEPLLTFDVITSAGTGQHGPVTIDYGAYTTTVSVPAGALLTDLSCDDGNSTGVASTGELTLNVEGGENIICTATVATAPGFAKAFTGAVIPGGTGTLELTITNSSATSTLTGLSFTDDLDAMLSGVQATGLPASDVCGAGSLFSGTGVIALRNGSLAPGANCVISVDLSIPATAAAGSYLNTTSDLFSNSIAITAPATASLTVDPAPAFSKVFGTNPLEAESVSTLTFTVDNTGSTIDAAALDFTDNFPAGMVIADPANAATDCSGGTLSAVPGSGVVSYSGGAVPASSSCTVDVDITVPTAGNYVNLTGDLTSSHGNSGTASDTLVVDPKPTGDITFIVNTDEDGTYGFASAEPELTFDIVTAAGSGQQGPVTIDYGAYTTTLSLPAGVQFLDLTCSDGNSTGDTATGELTLNVEADEVFTCTATVTASASRATAAINDFLQTRTDLLLANQPDRSRRLNRLRRGAGTEQLQYVPGQLAPFSPVTFDWMSVGSGNYHLSTSLDQVTRAAEYMQLATGNLGYDGTTHHTRRSFDVWFEGSWNEATGAANDGQFSLFYMGADQLVNENLLIGALVQFDTLTQTSSSLGSTIDGRGWMVGPYVTARVGPNLYFDGRLAWGESENDIDLGISTGQFDTERWMIDASLTGEFTTGIWTIRPNAELSYIEEHQFSYVDSLGLTVPEQTVTRGQFRVGPNVSARILGVDGVLYQPFFTLDAIYSHGDTDAVILGTVDGPDNGWRARLEAGISMTGADGSTMSITGNYDGIGQSDYAAWGVNVLVNLSF